MTRRKNHENVNFLVHLLMNSDIPTEIVTFTIKVFMDFFNPDEVMEILSNSTHHGKPLVNVVAEFSSQKVVELFFEFKHSLTDLQSFKDLRKLMSPDILKCEGCRKILRSPLHFLE